MAKRIIPISSGKGGVGKSSFAVNLALSLSTKGKTILVDLDTGTSSVRNVIAAPIKRDLYHFFKRGEALADCITTLPGFLDNTGAFENFGFVAGPMHMIDSITNMGQDFRNRMIDGINELDAEYVVIDLKAGLDVGVIDFLPQSNTGILVFTPNHPAATLAASDMAKAILFRKLRELFHVGSPIYGLFLNRVDPVVVNRMIDQAEDVYEPDLPNLDAFLEAMHDMVPGHPILKMLTEAIEYFRVYYVLNRFNGVDNSFQTAVKPFVENTTRNISARVNISNLGWVVESKAYHEANIEAIPYVLQQANKKVRKKKKAKLDDRLEELYALTGLRKEKPAKKAPKKQVQSTGDALDGQLKAIENLFQAKGGESVTQNFDYVVSCLDYLFQGKRAADFGETRILKKGELVPLIMKRYSVL